jgi:2Fe-2S ferredoxin
MPIVNFTQKDGTAKQVEAENGLSILEIAQSNDVDLDGNCGGALACATCHVIVGEDWISKIEKPLPEEEDLLDIVFGVTPNSRLSCQIIMSDELNGIDITIPA